jgi:hypothetical protein
LTLLRYAVAAAAPPLLLLPWLLCAVAVAVASLLLLLHDGVVIALLLQDLRRRTGVGVGVGTNSLQQCVASAAMLPSRGVAVVGRPPLQPVGAAEPLHVVSARRGLPLHVAYVRSHHRARSVLHAPRRHALAAVLTLRFLVVRRPAGNVVRHVAGRDAVEPFASTVAVARVRRAPAVSSCTTCRLLPRQRAASTALTPRLPLLRVAGIVISASGEGEPATAPRHRAVAVAVAVTALAAVSHAPDIDCRRTHTGVRGNTASLHLRVVGATVQSPCVVAAAGRAQLRCDGGALLLHVVTGACLPRCVSAVWSPFRRARSVLHSQSPPRGHALAAVLTLRLLLCATGTAVRVVAGAVQPHAAAIAVV